MNAIVTLLGGYRATAFAALLILATGLGLWWRADAAVAAKRAQAAETRAKAANTALHDAQHVIDVERQQAEAANKVAAQYEKERDHAEDNARRLAADLRSGAVKLRQPWRGPVAVPAPGAAPGVPDAATSDWAESAGRIVGAADQCDAQVRGLQDFILGERK